MRLPLLFARRYFSSKKSFSVINIISRVSSFAVGIPVAAMVILLSIFNGLSGLIADQNSLGNPDIRISPTRGKVFCTDSLDVAQLVSVEGVAAISSVLEESVLVEYRGAQATAVLRGVDTLYTEVVPIDKLIVEGNYDLQFGDLQQAVVGQGVAYTLGVRTALFDPLVLYTPNRGSVSMLLPISAAKSARLYPEGIYALDANHDGTYIFSTIEFAQRLFDYPDRLSSLEVAVEDGASADRVAEALQERLGEGYKVATRERQNASLYRLMQYEKWGVFFISLLVLVIASFSLVGSLIMLIIDKKDDLATLRMLGANDRFIYRIFLNEGMLISGWGAVGGIVLGLTVSLVQQKFGIVRIGGDSFLFDAYPVVVELWDVVGVVVATIAISLTITHLTVSRKLRSMRGNV